MALPVKCEAEYRQDRCPHVLVPIAAADDPGGDMALEGYKYRSVKCQRYLKRLNGVLARLEPAKDKETE